MTKFRRVVGAIGIALASMLFIVPTASAAEHHWANTRTDAQSDKMKVYWCAGGSAVLNPHIKTGKNICGLQIGYNHTIYAYDEETGTVLYDFCNTSDSRRVNFTSRTDSSNTVAVLYYDVKPDFCA